MQATALTERTRSLVLYAVLFLGVAIASGVAGYVYQHEPPRDQLTVRFEATPAPDPAVVSGAVSGIEGRTLTLTGADGATTLSLPDGAPIEDLVRLDRPPPAGTRVNVGVEDTEFGQVLTGVVSLERAP